MVIRVAFGRHPLGVVILFLAYVQLAPDDRLNIHRLRRVIEVNCAKNIAVIGHRDRRHPEFLYPFNQLVNVAGAIQEGVIGVQM